MNDAAWQAFSQRVTYEDRLPLAVQPGTDVAARELLDERNCHVLDSLATLDERRPDSGDENAAVLQELARLDGKLNVLMDIVGRLLVPDHALPPRQLLRLNGLGAELPAAVLPPAAQRDDLLLSIHFEACRALPLVLPVKFEQAFASEHVFVTFPALRPAVMERLEKLVFRQHRRKVAESRHSPS
jgi:hypothetical protein